MRKRSGIALLTALICAITYLPKGHTSVPSDARVSQVPKSMCFANKNGGYNRASISSSTSGFLEFMRSCYEYCENLTPIKPNENGWRYAGKYSKYDYSSKQDQKNCRDKWFRLVKRKGNRITVDQGVTSRLERGGDIKKYISDFPVVINCAVDDYSAGGAWRPIMPNTIIEEMALKFC